MSELSNLDWSFFTVTYSCTHHTHTLQQRENIDTHNVRYESILSKDYLFTVLNLLYQTCCVAYMQKCVWLSLKAWYEIVYTQVHHVPCHNALKNIQHYGVNVAAAQSEQKAFWEGCVCVRAIDVITLFNTKGFILFFLSVVFFVNWMNWNEMQAYGWNESLSKKIINFQTHFDLKH